MADQNFGPFPPEYVAWPWTEQNGRGEGTNERYGPETIAVWTIIDRFFLALEAGTDGLILPDPDYSKQFTEQQLDDLVKVALDEWFENKQNARWAVDNRGLEHERLPEFHRLAYLQRLALAQQLDAVLTPGAPAAPLYDPESGAVVD